MLIEKAVSFAPKEIVVGLYFGNDIYDAYVLAYKRSSVRRRCAPTRHLIGLKDRYDRAKAQFYWDEEKNFQTNYGRSSPGAGASWLRGTPPSSRLFEPSRVVARGDSTLITEVRTERGPEPIRIMAQVARTLTSGPLFFYGTAYRLAGLDLDDPRVGEGLRITNEALGEHSGSADKGRRGSYWCS